MVKNRSHTHTHTRTPNTFFKTEKKTVLGAGGKKRRCFLAVASSRSFSHSLSLELEFLLLLLHHPIVEVFISSSGEVKK
jgi:hypothetical protein